MPRARFRLIRVWGEPGQVYNARQIATVRRIRYAQFVIRNRKRLLGRRATRETAIQFAALRLCVVPGSLKNMLGKGRDVPGDAAFENAARRIGFEPGLLSNMLATECSQGVPREIAVEHIAQQLHVEPAALRAVLDLDTAAPCWLAIHPGHIEEFFKAGAWGPVQGIATTVQEILDYAPRDPVTEWPAIGWWA